MLFENMREALELLPRTRKRIEEGWCQGIDATDARGASVSPFDENASSFCLWAALEREAGLRAWVGLRALEFTCFEELVSFNDCSWRRKEDVLARIDRALDRLKNELDARAGDADDL